AKKFPFPHAGSRKRESIRSVSCFTKSSMAFTSLSEVNTSPWSVTLFFDFTWLISFFLLNNFCFKFHLFCQRRQKSNVCDSTLCLCVGSFFVCRTTFSI